MNNEEKLITLLLQVAKKTEEEFVAQVLSILEHNEK